MKKNEGNGVVIAFVFFLIGMICGFLLSKHVLNKQLLERGLMEYDSKTGVMEWSYE